MGSAGSVPSQLQHRPFTVEQANALGVSFKQLRGKRFRQLFRGVYVTADVSDTLELHCQGLQLLLPADAAFSHFTAAQLYGLPLERSVIDVSASSPRRRPAPRTGLRFHESVPEVDRWTYRNLPLTTPERTFVDLAQRVDLLELVVSGDAFLRRKLASRD